MAQVLGVRSLDAVRQASDNGIPATAASAGGFAAIQAATMTRQVPLLQLLLQRPAVTSSSSGGLAKHCSVQHQQEGRVQCSRRSSSHPFATPMLAWLSSCLQCHAVMLSQQGSNAPYTWRG